MTGLRETRRFAAAAAAVFALAACDSGGGSSGPAAAKVDVCALVPAGDLSDFLGAGASVKRSEDAWGPFAGRCTWSGMDAGRETKELQATLATAASLATLQPPRTAEEQYLGAIEMGRRMAGSAPTVADVSDVGDGAVWVALPQNNGGQLIVRRRDVVLVLTTDDVDQESAVSFAKDLLGRL